MQYPLIHESAADKFLCGGLNEYRDKHEKYREQLELSKAELNIAVKVRGERTGAVHGKSSCETDKEVLDIVSVLSML